MNNRIAIPENGKLKPHQVELLKKNGFPVPEGIENMTMPEYLEHVAKETSNLFLNSITSQTGGRTADGNLAIEVTSDSVQVGKVVDMVRKTQEQEEAANDPMHVSNLSPEIRAKISSEYLRLKEQYPKWKEDRLMRKAGEKFNVKFIFE